MLSQSLFERKVVIVDPLVTKNLSLRGTFLRYTQGTFFKTAKKFYRFCGTGEFFVQFDASPGHDTAPSAVFYTSRFTEATDVKIDSEDYTQISFGEVGLRVKFPDQNERKTWTNALSFFYSMYSLANVYGEVDSPEHIPSLVRLRITVELEQENWPKVKSGMDYSMFIQDKGIKGLLAESRLIKNRLLIGRAKLEARAERKPLFEGADGQAPPVTRVSTTKRYNPKDPMVIEASLVGSELVFLVLGQRPLCPIDQDQIRSDYAILEDQNIPKWLEFGSLYCFRYDEFGDRTEALHKIPTL